ncbi:DNA cytosine methyltransferase [Sideroxyarcus emersonii]|nr:DNA cytosine methyltransferase [Sideroxyarcus emersonii]
MSQTKPIPIVDLFAGPGGLGEGFSSVDDGKAFRIIVSAEMDASAHETLRLRAFYRILRRKGKAALKSYYRYCNGEAKQPYDDSNFSEWEQAGNEARQLTLGKPEDNKELDRILKKEGISPQQNWVLIGGPPCQAYSLVGRARNKGKADYKAEEDHRHFLYKEYLRIIQQYRPAVFVMENVKGILSSKVKDQFIFHTILRDLANPDRALKKQQQGLGYKIHSLVVPTVFDSETDPKDIDVRDFIIRAEEYGIPQARHRVILLGIREGIDVLPARLNKQESVRFDDVTNDLPKLRSKLSKEKDSDETWAKVIKKHLSELALEASHVEGLEKLETVLSRHSGNISSKHKTGSLRITKPENAKQLAREHAKWYGDDELEVWLNHEARGHMNSDLRRYVYAAAFAEAYKRSPKGHEEFGLKGLRPEHANWETGKFSDRFRVQLKNSPSTTVTSHIAKDGHYFIHPDALQCRSLTVREAARLQTFPDNYYFKGNRTQQFHQVGNAVPPMLAKHIASIVKDILR